MYSGYCAYLVPTELLLYFSTICCYYCCVARRYEQGRRKVWKSKGGSNVVPLELLSEELNHLAAILRVYAGGLNFMK